MCINLTELTLDINDFKLFSTYPDPAIVFSVIRLRHLTYCII